MDYVTLYQVKEYLKLSVNTEDSLFNNFIRWSSELIEYWKGRRFDVFRKTYLLDTPYFENASFGDYHSNQFNEVERLFANKELRLDTSKLDLLAVEELLNGDGTEILSTEYILEPFAYSKKNRILLKRSSSVRWLPDGDGNYKQTISLTGLFGFNRKYPDCFVDTGIELAEELSDSANDFVVTNVSEKAKDFLAPRIQIGNMLKMNDEFMLVSDIVMGDYNEDTVTIERAYNGTVADTHAADSKVYVYRPDGDIIQMALQLVRWRYRNKDVDNFDRTYNLATQTSTTPSALPADVRLILGTRKADL